MDDIPNVILLGGPDIPDSDRIRFVKNTGLPQDTVAHATTTIRIVQQVGGSFGTAVLAVLLERQTRAHAAGGTAGIRTAFGHTFVWSLGFTALALVCVLALPRALGERPAQDAPAQKARPATR